MRLFQSSRLLVLVCALFVDAALAAPIITATKDDNLAAGLRKSPGNTITYTTVISNTGDATATAVTLADPDPAQTTFVSVNSTPLARNDAYAAVGNVQITIAAPGVLANDNDADDAVNGAGTLSVTVSPATSANGGNVSVAANGGFTYNPAPGFTGADSFTYTMSDGEGNTDTATVTINVTGVIWFINAAAGGGDGRLTAPFNTLAAFTASPLDEAGDNIFLYSGSYTGNITLLNNQRLIGAGATSSLATITGLTPPTGSLAFPATGGARPTIGASNGIAVALGSGNSVMGLNVTNSNGAGISGGSVGTLTLADFDVTVTNGTALGMGSGGSVTATGTDNDLSATTGTALNVSNVTILAGNMTFKSISSNGGSGTGIILDGTGSSGGLRVTGLDGADAGTDPDPGSGGTIANKTGADGTTVGCGIYLNNTFDVRLAGMALNTFTNSAIRGLGVNGFKFEDSVISGTVGNNSAVIEGAIAFGDVLAVGTAGLTGSSLIDQVNVSGSIEHHLEFYNQTGTINLTISNSSIHDNTVASGSDGIQMEFRGNAQGSINIDTNQFTNNKSQAIQITTLESASINATIQSNTVTKGTQGNEGILVANGGDSDLTVLIGGPTAADGNTISGFGGAAIFAGEVPGQGTQTGQALLQATIQRNTITAPIDATNHAIIAFLSSEDGPPAQISQARYLIDFNNVTQNSGVGTPRGILVDTPDTGTLPNFHATVTNNTVTNTHVNGVTMISVAARRGTGHSAVQGNTVNMGPSSLTGLNVREAAPGTNELARGGSASNDSGVVLAANNPGSTTAVLPSAADIPVVANATVLLPATPTLPTVPLLFAPGGVDAAANSPTVVDDSQNLAERSAALRSSTPKTSTNASLPGVTQPQLDSLVAAARERWAATGLTGAQLATLRRLQFEVADLPGWYLGEAGGDRIRVDNNAGGNGWFIGAAAEDDALFLPNEAISATRRYTDPASAPAGRIDLLTALLHEMGHALGLDDTYAQQDRDSVMYGFLTKGERRLPAKNQAAGATPHADGATHFLSTPLTIGDLPVGKTVTITYIVTINPATAAISTSSQGTVSGGGFSTVNGLSTAVPNTDDPQFAGVQATVTPIHQPPVVSNVNVSTNEDTTLTFTAANFTGSYSDPNGDALVSVRIVSLPAAGAGILKVGASNATAGQDVLAANLGTITFVPTGNFNGGASFSWNASDGTLLATSAATVNITVNAVNDVPSFTKGVDQTVLEDAGAQSVTGWATALSAGPADEAGQVLNFIVSNNNNALFSSQPAVAANGTLTYTPAVNANGTATVTVQIHDTGGTSPGVDTSVAQTFVINVTTVNDVPSFTKGADQTVLEDATAQTVAGWATALSAGAANESAQVLNFIVSNNNNALFSAQPAVAANGTLTYTPVANANGTATVSVQIHDTGGVLNGGVDTSAAQTFVINVTAVNDAPSFTKGADQTVLEDAAAQTVTGWATALSPGPANESAQVLNFIVSNNNNALFSAQPAVAANGTLTYTPAANANGTATVSVQIHDSGGTSPGVDTSAAQTFVINVTAVNDKPTFTAANPPTVNENAGAQTVTPWVTNFNPGPNETGQTVLSYAVSGVTNAALFSAQPVVANNGTLTYTPAANVSGSSDFTVTVKDNGGTTNLGVDTSDPQTFTITVGAANAAPALAAIEVAALPYTENQAATAITGTLTVNDSDSANLTGATVQITGNYANGQDLLAFAPQLGITGNFDQTTGVLMLTGSSLVANYQTALRAVTYQNTSDNPSVLARTVSFRVNDGAGSNNLSNIATRTIDLTAINDAPTLNAIPDPPSIPMNSGAQTINLSGITAGGGESQTLTVAALSGNTPLIPNPTVTYTSANPTGSLSYTPVAGQTGTAVITVMVMDSGGTAGGGVNTFSRTFTVNVGAPANQNPVANPDTIERFATQSTKVLESVLVANDTDPENDTPLVVTAVGPAASGQATVSRGSGFVFYLPNAGFSGIDSFTYTLSDSHGGTATGTVTVNITQDTTQSKNITKIEMIDGSMRVSFAGIPGRSYRVESTEDLTPTPTWTMRGTFVADALGAFQFTDPPPLPPMRFYRSVFP